MTIRTVENVEKDEGSADAILLPLTKRWECQAPSTTLGCNHNEMHTFGFRRGWATCQPGTCQVGRLVRRPGEPPRQML